MDAQRPAPHAKEGHRVNRRTRSRWLPLVRNLLTLGFIALVVTLLTMRARRIDWAQVGESLQQIEAGVLITAAALTALSYSLHSCYDLIGRAYTHHRLTVPKTLAIAFTSYTFNMSLGALIGGMAFRYRLYTQFGLGGGHITRILGMSVWTNWLGYLFLGGMVFATRRLDLPDDWRMGEDALQLLGLLFLAVVLAYVGLCRFATRRNWVIRRVHLKLPSGRMALLQLLLATCSWLTIATLLHHFLPQIPFPALLAVLMVASSVGAATHVPGNLGVTEAVFLAFFSAQMPENELLAALIAYRAVYYLGPLLLGTLLYIALEARARRNRRVATACKSCPV